MVGQTTKKGWDIPSGFSWLNTFLGGEEGTEEEEKERGKKQTKVWVLFLDQIAEIKHRSLRLWKWCLHYTLLALMPQGESE